MDACSQRPHQPPTHLPNNQVGAVKVRAWGGGDAQSALLLALAAASQNMGMWGLCMHSSTLQPTVGPLEDHPFHDHTLGTTLLLDHGTS